MALSSFIKGTIKALGTVSEKGIELGSETIGNIAEKISSNSYSKEKITNGGKKLGEVIKKNADKLAEDSVDYIDKAVDLSKKAYKSASEEISISVNNVFKKYNEHQKENKLQESQSKYINTKNKLNVDIETNTNNEKQKNEYANKINTYGLEVVNTKIVGVTFENRQPAIMRLRVGQEVTLVRESYNSYDKNAIAVKNGNQMLGYIPKGTNKDLANAMDKGVRYKAIVTRKNGGNGLSYGANIRIIKI